MTGRAIVTWTRDDRVPEGLVDDVGTVSTDAAGLGSGPLKSRSQVQSMTRPWSPILTGPRDVRRGYTEPCSTWSQ